MEKMEAHIEKIETQLKQWAAKLDELVAKAEATGTEAKIEYRKRIGDFEAKYQIGQSKLDELRAAGRDKWESFKPGLERARNELEAAFKELTK